MLFTVFSISWKVKVKRTKPDGRQRCTDWGGGGGGGSAYRFKKKWPKKKKMHQRTDVTNHGHKKKRCS